MGLLFTYFIKFSHFARYDITFLVLITTLVDSPNNPGKHTEGPLFPFYRWGN